MRIITCALLFFSLSCSLNAQTKPSAKQPDAQAQSLVQRATTAQLGNSAIQDVQLTGSVVLHGGTDSRGSITLAADTSGRSRVVLNLDSGTRAEYSSGHSENPACTWTDSNGKTRETSLHNCRTNGVWFLPTFPLSAAQAEGVVAFSYSGSEAKDGVATEHLVSSKTVAKSNPTTTALIESLSRDDLYFDSETLLPTSLKFFIHPDDDAKTDIPVEVKFSDYRDVNGVKIPFHIEKFVNGSSFLEINIDSAAFNTGTMKQTGGAQ